MKKVREGNLQGKFSNVVYKIEEEKDLELKIKCKTCGKLTAIKNLEEGPILGSDILYSLYCPSDKCKLDNSTLRLGFYNKSWKHLNDDSNLILFKMTASLVEDTDEMFNCVVEVLRKGGIIRYNVMDEQKSLVLLNKYRKELTGTEITYKIFYKLINEGYICANKIGQKYFYRLKEGRR